MGEQSPADPSSYLAPMMECKTLELGRGSYRVFGHIESLVIYSICVSTKPLGR